MKPLPQPKPKSTAEKATRTVVDTIGFTREEAANWILPPFQRPLRMNEKVRALAETIRNDGGVIPGIVTFGILSNVRYLLDGQHRREAFLISEKEQGFADARTCYFDSMAEMGEEFVKLNSRLVVMRPDDMLRGMEGMLDCLQKIREACPFVGYDNVRRGTSAPVLSMSLCLRAWEQSRSEVPNNTCASGLVLANAMHTDDAKLMCNFLKACYTAWGRDEEYVRLWSSLNLILCMWLYRRTVLVKHSPRTTKLTTEQFVKGLLSLSASSPYLDWLVGRRIGERDRAPGYSRITQLFGTRLQSEFKEKIQFPRPAWALGKKCG